MSKDMKQLFDNTPPRKVERRKGLDRRGKIGIILSVAGGTLWTAGLLFTYIGYPQQVNYFDTLFNKSPRVTWEPLYIFIAVALWAAGVLLCILSLFQFRKRYRRRADKKHMGIITMLILNAVSLISFSIFIFVMGF